MTKGWRLNFKNISIPVQSVESSQQVKMGSPVSDITVSVKQEPAEVEVKVEAEDHLSKLKTTLSKLFLSIFLS